MVVIVGETEDFGWYHRSIRELPVKRKGLPAQRPFFLNLHLVILSSSIQMVAEATLLTLPNKGGFKRRSLIKLLVIM